MSGLTESIVIERRNSPRIAANLSVELLPENVKCNILNLSETGICFDSQRPSLSGEVLLSIDLSNFRPQQVIETPAKVVWNKACDGQTVRTGTRFISVNEKVTSKIRDFIFDGYAKRASAIIEDNNSVALKMKVEDFFNNEVKRFHEVLSVLTKEISNQMTTTQDIEKILTILTNNLLVKGDTIEKLINNNLYMEKIKEIFRVVTGSWFYQSPIMKMAYQKPRGYPGDYQLFEIIYDNKPLGEGIGNYFDRCWLDGTYTVAVRTRKDKMKSIIKDYIGNTSSSCVRLLNIACGPSREIRELLSDPIFLSHLQKKEVVYTGLDNDPMALEFSKSRLDHLPSNLEVRFLNENVIKIAKDGKNYSSLIGKQDVIYILGLSEYLPDRIFKRLITFLFELLNDQGMLVVTYKDKDIPVPGIPPDWLNDWTFNKWSQEDLVNLANGLGSDIDSFRIEKEITGCIFFLMITKS
jgi:hypothetical protein